MFLYILLQTSAVKSYNGGSTKPGIVEDWSRKGLQGHTLVSCVLFHSMCDPPSSIYHTSSNLHATKPTTFVFHTTFFFKIFPIYFACYYQAVCNIPPIATPRTHHFRLQPPAALSPAARCRRSPRRRPKTAPR